MSLKIIILSLLILSMGACSKSDKNREENKEIAKESVKNNLGWKIGQDKDEWGDLTGDKYAYGWFTGTFNNSATTDGSVAIVLSVKTTMIGEKLDTIVGFSLGEYDGRNAVTNMDLKGKARNSKGEIIEFPLYIGNNGWGMLISEINVDIFNFLCKGGKIDVILEEDSKYGVPSKYKFSIPSYLNIQEAVAKINE